MGEKSVKKIYSAVVTLLTVFLLTACGLNSETAQLHSASNSPGQRDSTDASSSPRVDGSAPSEATHNALDLSGPVEATKLADMQAPMQPSQPKLPATVTDSQGRSVRITTAERVLSLDLYGTTTDTMIGLGLSAKLVGRSNSDTQQILNSLPTVTRNGHDLNIEAVLNLKPDLIVTNLTIGSAANYQQLESAGITVLRLPEVPAIKDIGGSIRLVADAFGLNDKGEALAQKTSDSLEQARRTVQALRSKTPVKPKAAVLYVRGTAGVFFILGANYGASDLIDALALDDVSKSNNITGLKPANAESLLTLNPDIILAMEQGVQSAGGIKAFLSRPGLSATNAGKNQRVITAPDSQLLSYGPRTPQNIVALAEAIYTRSGNRVA